MRKPADFIPDTDIVVYQTPTDLFFHGDFGVCHSDGNLLDFDST